MLNDHKIALASKAVSAIPDMDNMVLRFYDNLFAAAPQVRSMFSDDLHDQSKKLSQTLALAFSKLHDLDALVPVLKEMGKRHIGYGAVPEHYTAVAQTLIETMANELGAAFDLDTRAAIEEILDTVAGVMLEGAAEAA